MIKKIIFGIVLTSSFLSCSNPNRKIKTTDCIVVSCENKKKIVSIHDEINRDSQRWEIRTSCGFYFLSTRQVKVGDTLEVIIEDSI